jgi:hypothetical protein
MKSLARTSGLERTSSHGSYAACQAIRRDIGGREVNGEIVAQGGISTRSSNQGDVADTRLRSDSYTKPEHKQTSSSRAGRGSRKTEVRSSLP